MLEIDLYNRNLDFTLFSKSEVSEIKKKYGDDIIPNNLGNEFGVNIEYDDISIKYSLSKEIPVPRKNVLLVWYFVDGDITILNALLDNYSNKKGYKIIVVAESYAEAWMFSIYNDKEKLYKDRFLQAKNFYLIHFEPFFKQERCFFSKKIALQNLLNVVPSVGVYHWMHPYFNSIKKPNRVGLHLNRLNQQARIIFAKMMFKHNFFEHKNMFFTLNKNQINYTNSEIIKIQDELGYDIFDKVNNENYGVHTFQPFYLTDWYLPNLFDLSLKSDIEIVYETTTADNLELKHLTEKTIKHLMLGKPIFFCEPIAYYILSYFGYKNYDSLYTKELLEKYKEYDLFDDTKNQIFLQEYVELQTKNVEWLLNMPEKQWENILEECKEIAEHNYQIITKVLFEENIRDIIKQIDKMEIDLKENII